MDATKQNKVNTQCLYHRAIASLLMVFVILSGLGGMPVRAEQVFLEGFPDVPLLSGFEEQVNARVVFDTPSGTVAETAFQAQMQGSHMLQAYAKELPTFGWACVSKSDTVLRCTREKNTLTFTNKMPAAQKGLIILRLKPSE